MSRMVVFLVVGLMALSCGDTESGGAEIEPHVSPVQLGKFWPTGSETPELGNRDRTPYEFVLLLLSSGDADLNVSKICLGGDDANFELEGPLPNPIRPGDQGAIRVTYLRTSTGSDRAAIVVKSNATNLPSLVVPLCAEVVADGEEKNIVSLCEISEEVAQAAADDC